MAQSQATATRAPSRDPHLDFAPRGGNGDRGAQGGFPRCHGQLDMDISTLETESGMGRDPHHQVQVAVRTRARARPPLAGKPDSLTFDHPRGDGHLQRSRSTGSGNRDASFPAPESLIKRDRELGLVVGADDGTPTRPSCRLEQVPEEALGVEPVRAEVDPTIPIESPSATLPIPVPCRGAALCPGRWVYSIGNMPESCPNMS